MPKPIELSAIYVTAVFMTVTSDGVRLSFGEGEEGKADVFKTAIYMPHSVAERFQKLYVDTIAKHTQQQN